jgi:hypothetical protein
MKKMRFIKLIPLFTLFLICPADAASLTGKAHKDWLTYSNATYGFSFHYPKTLVVNNRDVALYHIEGQVLFLTLNDKNNLNGPAVLAIHVMEPYGNKMVAVYDFPFLRKVCKKYTEVNLGGRKAVNCITYGRAACQWEIIVPGVQEFHIQTVLSEESVQDGPQDGEYPLRSIIDSVKFTNAK